MLQIKWLRGDSYNGHLFPPEKGVKGFERFKVVQAPKKKKSKKVRELVGRATSEYTDGLRTYPDGYFGVRKSMEKRVTREASYTFNLKSLNVVGEVIISQLRIFWSH